MSGGRLGISVFRAGELISAAEGFDAVSQRLVECNDANASFWTSRRFTQQNFTVVPFGLYVRGLYGILQLEVQQRRA